MRARGYTEVFTCSRSGGCSYWTDEPAEERERRMLATRQEIADLPSPEPRVLDWRTVSLPNLEAGQ